MPNRRKNLSILLENMNAWVREDHEFIPFIAIEIANSEAVAPKPIRGNLLRPDRDISIVSYGSEQRKFPSIGQ